MDCEKVRGQDLVTRYVAGDLSGEDMDAFEQHYFGCEECLSAVQIGQAIREGATKEPVQDTPGPKVVAMPAVARPPRRGWMIPLAAAAALVVAAVIGWRVMRSEPGAKVEVSKSGAQPAVQTEAPPQAQPTTPAPEPQLLASSLGEIEPLPYRASVLRGSSEDAAERFRSAMESYTSRDYRKAAARLVSIPVGVPGAGAADEHVTDAGIELYLGISQLMINLDADAVRSLRRAAQYGDTPYLESARFYLAKGLLREKQYTEAARQLRQTVALNGDRRADAQKLLDQIEHIQTR
jgi:tetratricopeptide (TPR) repeat protein